MLEDRIIVQDRGIDAGLAALMQNANKGMDPAALMAMMNNGGFGGNGGWWWIWIILIFFCWGGFGGNGFGRGGNDAGRLASQLNTDANTSLLMQAINGNKEAISSLSNTLNCDINAVQTALNTINSGVSQISCDTKLSSCEVINAITSGNATLASELANCCCTTQRSIDAVNNNITKMGYDTYKQRKEAIAKCDEEMAKCQVLLDKLGVDNEPARENDKILELQKEVSELKNIIRKANQMVPPPMKEMLPQDMKNAMDKVGQ